MSALALLETSCVCFLVSLSTQSTNFKKCWPPKKGNRFKERPFNGKTEYITKNLDPFVGCPTCLIGKEGGQWMGLNWSHGTLEHVNVRGRMTTTPRKLTAKQPKNHAEIKRKVIWTKAWFLGSMLVSTGFSHKNNGNLYTKTMVPCWYRFQLFFFHRSHSAVVSSLFWVNETWENPADFSFTRNEN